LISVQAMPGTHVDHYKTDGSNTVLMLRATVFGTLLNPDFPTAADQLSDIRGGGAQPQPVFCD
jgi:hypothetical protein